MTRNPYFIANKLGFKYRDMRFYCQDCLQPITAWVCDYPKTIAGTLLLHKQQNCKRALVPYWDHGPKPAPGKPSTGRGIYYSRWHGKWMPV